MKKCPQLTEEFLRELVMRGMSGAAIAREVGCTAETVNNRRREFGIGYTDFTFEELFWINVDKNGPTPGHCLELGKCWIWTKGKDSYGYGLVTTPHLNVRQAKASRVSWIIHFGDPGNKRVLHKCDNPSCINPNHLFLGTQLDNMRDCSNKNRMSSRTGSNNGRSTVDESFVRQVRCEYIPRSTTNGLNALVKKYDIPYGTLQKIITRETWSHVS